MSINQSAIKISITPNRILCVVFLISALLHELLWSDLYQHFSLAMWFFIVSLVFANIYIDGKVKIIIDRSGSLPSFFVLSKRIDWVAILLIILFLLIDYLLGKIPTITILLLTFSMFYSLCVFHNYVVSGQKTFLIGSFLLVFFIFVFSQNRIVIFSLVFSMMALYVNLRRPLWFSWRTFVFTFVAIVAVYLFGVLGNFIKGEEYADGTFILAIGEASAEFESKIGSSEFFWGYLYLTSPLANLDLNFTSFNVGFIDINNILRWAIIDLAPDFISKHVLVEMGGDLREGLQINNALNVSTVFLNSYLYLGWFGVVSMIAVVVIFPFIYLYFLRDSQFLFVGLSILSSVYALLVFDNVLKFSAISFQLAYPFLFEFRKLRNGYSHMKVYE